MFAEWMQNNWGSLFHDNIDFWVPYLAESCEAIKNKMDKHYDIQDERFCIAQFIDCIVIPSSRTGGGPMTPGKFAERYPLLVQESVYNCWARVHGVKKQAIGMANGMAFNVTKGYSCRRNDMHVLGDSDMDSRLEEVTEYMRFGDSAYPHMAKITSRNSLDEFEDINRYS